MRELVRNLYEKLEIARRKDEYLAVIWVIFIMMFLILLDRIHGILFPAPLITGQVKIGETMVHKTFYAVDSIKFKALLFNLNAKKGLIEVILLLFVWLNIALNFNETIIKVMRATAALIILVAMAIGLALLVNYAMTVNWDSALSSIFSVF